MNTPEENLLKLNAIFEAESFSVNDFAGLINQFKALPNLKFILYDFVFYNEKLLHESQKIKVASIKSAHYEMAARMRDDERTCQKHIDLKNKRNIDKSTFIFENNQLVYLYFGNAKNDNLVLPYFKRLKIT